MTVFTPGIAKRFATGLTGALAALVILAFSGQMAAAGPNCAAGKESKAGCEVKSCAAITTCAAAVKTDAQASAQEKKPCTKEECIAKCMAAGMTEEQAEACWAQHAEGKSAPCHADNMMHQTSAGGCPHHAAWAASAGEKKLCTKEECIAKCMAAGMTKEQAEACWAKHAEGKTSACQAETIVHQATATAGCAHHAQTAGATEKKTCTKEECVAKLVAAGMSKEDAEKKAEACLAGGKCTHEAGKGCCALVKTAAATH